MTCPYCPAEGLDWGPRDFERHVLRVHGDAWLPGNLGQEEPFTTRTGRRLLWVWHPRTGEHAYLDVQTDLILTEAESRAALAMG